MMFLGLSVFEMILICDLALVAILLLDSFQGHLRRGFYRWTQYLPFVIGLGYMVVLVGYLFDADWANAFTWACGVLAFAGVLGFALHQYFGIARKPGGYSWFFHYLMYGPTALAPLGLTAAAAIGYSAKVGSPFLLLISLCLLFTGSLLQSWVLHFRGAFNNVAMYLPYTFPLVSLVFQVLAAVAVLSNGVVAQAGEINFMFYVAIASFIATSLIGFIGAGMHLRGFDRQNGGLGIALFNYLSGPPAFAPLVFTVGGALSILAFYFRI